MVLQLIHNILWIFSEKPLPLWFPTHPFFCSIHQKGRSENMPTSEIEAPRTTGSLAPLSHVSARTTTVILIAFAAVYILRGSAILSWDFSFIPSSGGKPAPDRPQPIGAPPWSLAFYCSSLAMGASVGPSRPCHRASQRCWWPPYRFGS